MQDWITSLTLLLFGVALLTGQIDLDNRYQLMGVPLMMYGAAKMVEKVRGWPGVLVKEVRILIGEAVIISMRNRETRQGKKCLNGPNFHVFRCIDFGALNRTN